MQLHARGSRGCDVPLAKVYDGERKSEPSAEEVEGELTVSYAIIKLQLLKVFRMKNLKGPSHEVILNWWFGGTGTRERRRF